MMIPVRVGVRKYGSDAKYDFAHDEIGFGSGEYPRPRDLALLVASASGSGLEVKIADPASRTMWRYVTKTVAGQPAVEHLTGKRRATKRKRTYSSRSTTTRSKTGRRRS